MQNAVLKNFIINANELKSRSKELKEELTKELVKEFATGGDIVNPIFLG